MKTFQHWLHLLCCSLAFATVDVAATHPEVPMQIVNDTQQIKVLQFNIWQEGTRVKGGYEAIVTEIASSGPDLVALSEVRNFQSQRLDQRLVNSLYERGYQYYAQESDGSGLLSRHPIIKQSVLYPRNDDHGSITRAVIDFGSVELVFYSAHLDPFHYSPYLPRGYDDTTWKPMAAPITDVELMRTVNAASERDEAIDSFLADAREQYEQGRIVILAGDFNEPSHLDWTEATKDLFDHNGVIMPWRNTMTLEEAGYVDSYRRRYPDPVTHPGFTYPVYNRDANIMQLASAPKADERDRIDYIFYYPNERLRLINSTLVGPRSSIRYAKPYVEQTNDPFIEPRGVWPSDHRALLSTFDFTLSSALNRGEE